MVGIVASLVLRYVDTLSKAVASSTTILFTTVLGRIFFGIEISGQMIISAVLVIIGVHSYTFSNEENTNLTLILVKRSLFKTFRQLWFIPAFFYLISMYDLVQPSSTYDLVRNTASLISSFNGTNPEMILYHGKVVSIGNLENQHWLDENLHQLNGGQKFTASKWQQYVRLHLSNPLVKTLLETKGYRVLDVGCGGGAFSRSLLQLYKGVEILGVDHSKTDSNGAFHIAMLIDSLCYLPNSEAVEKSIANALYLLRPGGLLISSMIPQTTLEAHDYCKTAITRKWIEKKSQTLFLESFFGVLQRNKSVSIGIEFRKEQRARLFAF